MNTQKLLQSLYEEPYFKVVKKFNGGKKSLKTKFYNFATNLGHTVSQNKNHKKIVEIKPDINKILKLKKKNKKIKSVLRYHQTNLGGSIHSDGPQLSSPPKFIIMACESNSLTGGDTILVNTLKIYNYLKKKKPDILKILKKNIFFERRGFNYSGKNVFSKPIFLKSKKKFLFRYLRDYIEKGYEIKKKKLNKNQIFAFNYLDKLLSNRKFIKKTKLSKGDLVILNNHILAHGRTTFKIDKKRNTRKLFRIWIN